VLVEMPVAFEEFSKGTESLLEFYSKLGWDSQTQFIDPRKIKINSEDADTCMTHFMSAGETPQEQAQFGLFWMNQGPAHSPDVPKGKVLLEDKWVESA
jgi:hypothetical protein